MVSVSSSLCGNGPEGSSNGTIMPRRHKLAQSSIHHADLSETDLLSDDGARREVERRMAVGVVQIEQIDSVPIERVEKRLLRPPRPVAPELPPEVPRVEHAPEVPAEEVHERA